MESGAQSDRLELLSQANACSELANNYFAKRDEARERVQPETERLDGRAQEIHAEIEEKKNQALCLGDEFRRLYEESHEAYEEGDRELAKRLGNEGHKVQNRCERLNEEIAHLYDELKRLNARKAELASEARSWHDLAIAEVEKAKELRKQAN